MKVTETPIPGMLIIEPRIFGDQRGYFFESYNQQAYQEAGLNYNFVQDNEAKSKYGVLRGLHFQRGDMAQAKLVRVSEGMVFDVGVDVREGSPTYGKHFGMILSAENKKQLLVPRGFAHGYLVLSETAVFNYKCDNFYSQAHEGGVAYNDPDINITWPIEAKDVILSEKDIAQPSFKEATFGFVYKELSENLNGKS